nr:energy transducer TonB [Dechloromonas sp.]
MSAAALRAYAVPRPFGRRFAVILGLSVALHGGLFLFNSWQRQRPPLDLPPIMASIRLLAPIESGSPAVVVPVPAAIPQKVRQATSRRENRSSPAAQAFAGPANVPAQAAAGSAPAAVVAPAAESAPAAAVAAPQPAAANAPDLLAAYRQQLTRLLAGQREYPRIAALRGWEGEVRLRLRVARKGNLLGVALDRSSGFEVLDQHALAMLAAMSGLPPLPEGLDGGEIQVVVPIHYKLNKTT